MRRRIGTTAVADQERDLLRQRIIVWRLLSILLIAGATIFEIIRGESWMIIFVAQFFASVIWVVMPVLVSWSWNPPDRAKIPAVNRRKASTHERSRHRSAN